MYHMCRGLQCSLTTNIDLVFGIQLLVERFSCLRCFSSCPFFSCWVHFGFYTSVIVWGYYDISVTCLKGSWSIDHEKSWMTVILLLKHVLETLGNDRNLSMNMAKPWVKITIGVVIVLNGFDGFYCYYRFSTWHDSHLGIWFSSAICWI